MNEGRLWVVRRVTLTVVGAAFALFGGAGGAYALSLLIGALGDRNGGFIGEGYIFANALLLFGLAILGASAVAGLLAYLCLRASGFAGPPPPEASVSLDPHRRGRDFPR